MKTCTIFESGDILSVIEKARFLNTQWNRTFCAHCIHLSLITSGIYIVFHLTMTSFLYVFPSVSISVVCTFTYCGIKYQTLFIFTYLTLQSHLRELTNNSCRNRRNLLSSSIWHQAKLTTRFIIWQNVSREFNFSFVSLFLGR